MIDFDAARKNMVDGQIHTASVVNPHILDSFSRIPRELFVPEKQRDISYVDECINIGQGRYLMEAVVLARLLQAAEPKQDNVALVVGSDSGYSCAILSTLVSTVIAVEDRKRHLDRAARAFEKLDICNIATFEKPIVDGDKERAPYDVILINGAVESVPDIILSQLAKGGRLITVLNNVSCSVGQATLFSKNEQGHISSRALFDASVPLIEDFTKETVFTF